MMWATYIEEPNGKVCLKNYRQGTQYRCEQLTSPTANTPMIRVWATEDQGKYETLTVG